MSLPAEPQSQLEHTYAHGALASSATSTPATAPPCLQVADYDIDKNTGLTKVSRDSAGVATTFRYDALDPTRARGAHGERLDDDHLRSADDDHRRLLPTHGAAVPERSAELLRALLAPLLLRRPRAHGARRDAVPRGYRHRQRPSGSSPNDALGRKTKESQWEDANLTTDFEYDRFGRVRKITPPDLNLAPTVVTYRGERRIDRSDKVATAAAGAEHYVCSTGRNTMLSAAW